MLTKVAFLEICSPNPASCWGPWGFHSTGTQECHLCVETQRCRVEFVDQF